MMPVIHSGDPIGIKKVDLNNILYGEIYGVITEDWRTIKYIRKSSDNSKIKLIPENLKDFDEQEIDKSRIKHIFLVKSWGRRRC